MCFGAVSVASIQSATDPDHPGARLSPEPYEYSLHLSASVLPVIFSVECLVTHKMCPFVQQPLTVGKLIPFCLKAIPVSALKNYFKGTCLVTLISRVSFREETSLCFMSESRHQERLKIIAEYVCLPC